MESLDAIQPTDAGDFGWSEVAIEPIVVTIIIVPIAITDVGDFGGARGFLSNFQPITPVSLEARSNYQR